MRVKAEPACLRGTVRAITSKSAAHRSLICAALCSGPSRLRISDRSADIDATIECLRAMGAGIEPQGEYCLVSPIRRPAGQTPGLEQDPEKKPEDLQSIALNCGESGSTLRFLLPVAAALWGGTRQVIVTGEGRLPQRPMGPLLRVMTEHGTAIRPGENEGTQTRRALPLSLCGGLRSGVYQIEGNVSSQYISGLLFALPLLEGDSVIQLTSPMESAAYVNLTVETLRKYGIRAEELHEAGDAERTGFFVPGGQAYIAADGDVEGDWSNAAFFLAAGAVGGGRDEGGSRDEGVTCAGLRLDSTQGDKAAVEILKGFGAAVTVTESGGAGAVRIAPAPLAGQEIDVSQIPDLMPILAVAACRALGRTVFYNAGRLRLKESDRIAATASMIRALGGRAEEGPDSLSVYGDGRLRGGAVDSFGDHRIAMSAAIAALFCDEAVIIEGAEAVRKSYPNFYRDYNALGGKADVI